ncbi:MAG: ABC transporter substrate-binding protein [Paludibacteraceae bacterium]|nr:ABC transporter substrate-binding protein [Paludibacteraceae bacterium]
MKSIFLKFLLTIVFIELLAGCAKQSANNANTEDSEHSHYAIGFTLTDSASYRIVSVISPWTPLDEMARYYLTREKQLTAEEQQRMQGKCVITIPLQRIGVTSCTHIGFLDAIGCKDALVGVCNPELVYTDLSTVKGMKEGTLNIGDAMAPDIERVVFAHPDMMFISTYAQGDATSTQLEKMGIPVLYINEWMEEDPLARAEWVRLIAAFMDKEDLADSIFNAVEERYDSLSHLWYNRPLDQRPSIMSGQDFRGTWYVPSGNTYMGQLFRDAGAAYYYQDTRYKSSIPLTFERALVDFADADIWVGVNAHTLDELKQINSQHTLFRSYQTGRVYHFERRATPSGANDFWERGVVHPDELLADLIGILYPGEIQDPPTYIEQLH